MFSMLFNMNPFWDFLKGLNIFRSNYGKFQLKWSCIAFLFPSLYTTQSEHQTNYSTKAILCNIIQFQVAIPFPRYHSASDGTVTSSAMISV